MRRIIKTSCALVMGCLLFSCKVEHTTPLNESIKTIAGSWGIIHATRSGTDLTSGFETDHEITAKMIRRGLSIRETPIAYLPRSREEGKKIKASDGFIAVWTLLRFRFRD